MNKKLLWLIALLLLLNLVQCTRSCNSSRLQKNTEIVLVQKDSIIQSQKDYIVKLKSDSALMDSKISNLTTLVELSKGNLEKFTEAAKSWKSQTTIKLVQDEKEQ